MSQPQQEVRILGLVGSLRRNSHNRLLLAQAIALAPGGVEIKGWDGLKALPPFDQDDETTPSLAVQRLREAVTAASGLLVVTPEYNGSLPGQLKNALDWASRPRERPALDGKLAAVIGASPSPGGARQAVADGKRVLGRAGALVLDEDLAIPHAHVQFDASGRLTDQVLRGRLAELLVRLAAVARSRTLLAA